ncbi:hypothetical protein [Brasilonema sp. UFV-L1]|uniref:hypothetical protein n=1 Tax=Brasilonema sp. UFV-L1 TaxID=2234130 RepID=UPI00145DA339|nr:hypothetical protein [Brasilonema sp. UFV-L1]NMG09755.1 hypothetical protein [Brasilonema sp. UFV-L1]
MSRYLDSEQQERFDRIINEFADGRDTNQEGLTVKVGITIVYRSGVDSKPNIDRIKPEELEKLEAAVNTKESALGVVEVALYTPAQEEVFRYENGDVSVKSRKVNQRNKETESDSLLSILQTQQTNTQQQVNLQQENSATQKPNQERENQLPNNQIYLDKEFGYLSTDYYLRDASHIFGEWAKQFTPNGIYMMSQMGLDWQYFADKYSHSKAAAQLTQEAAQLTQGAAELPQLPPVIEQPTIDQNASTYALTNQQPNQQDSTQALTETLAQMHHSIADIQKQLEEMHKQQAERLEQVSLPQENQLSKWIDGIKQNFTNTVQEIGSAVRSGIDYLKDTTRELVGRGLEATTKLAVETLGVSQSDGSKLLAAGNIEYRLQGQQLSAQPQQQDWASLSLSERLEAIRNQYGITQSSQGEKQQQQYQERSR